MTGRSALSRSAIVDDAKTPGGVNPDIILISVPDGTSGFPRRVKMTNVPPGGPSAINGVLYQMLWTLLRTTHLHASGCVPDEQTGQITQATLRLEPSGGGGDLQEIGQSSKVVQQLKARSDEGTWSLTEVVEGVLPDLYLAVDLAFPDTAYEFVTEGRIGRWENVYKFFQSLSRRVCPDDDALAALDDTKALKLGITSKRSCEGSVEDEAFWPKKSYTERRLFERIVQEVRKRKAVGEEPIATTHRKLWNLLGHFRFVGEQTMKLLQREVDRYLLQLVEYDSEVPEQRDALLMGLARLATQGGADINDSARFLAEHGLASTPFSAWPVLQERSRIYLAGELERLGYRANEDVRLTRAQDVASEWAGGKPMLVVSGNSGQGKSWLLYALARQLTAGPELIVLVEATGKADGDLEEAARICWHEIKNNDSILWLNRIADRLRRVDSDRAGGWLNLFVDGVQNAEEARGLAKQPWERWGARLLVSCEPEVAGVFEKAAQGRCAATVPVGDFTPEELQRYLTRCFGTDWPDIPGDVRDTLRRPLLARLYRDIAQLGAWSPANEYELCQRYWDRLGEDERIGGPLDRVGLERLARSILDGAPYPWTAEQLLHAGLDNQAINAMIRVGWLRRTPREQFEVWHNRLLNWAVAAALVNSFRSGNIRATDFCFRLRELYLEPDRYGGRFLGYATMDALWLLTKSDGEFNNLLDQALRTLEDMPWHPRQVLYAQFLPTLGTAIVPALFKRLEAVAPSEDPTLPLQVVDAITTFEEKNVAESAFDLLRCDNPRTQRIAMRILSRRPSAKALDRLWELHCSGQANPAPYLSDGEQHDMFLYEDSFGALRSCVRLQPSWLERIINHLETAAESMRIHDLAYLLANLDDAAALWHRCKPALYHLIPTDRERCLASNIYKHTDAEEIDWLVGRVHREDDLLGPMALRALIKLDPDLAVQHLDRLPSNLLCSTRRWCFEEILAKRPEATYARIAEMLKRSADPFDIALVFTGDENSLTVDILDVLLDRLETILEKDLVEPRPPNQHPPYRAFLMLSRLDHPDLLECMRRRRGTPLEDKLTEWLLREGPLPDVWEQPPQRDGLRVLYKFGGNGFTRVVNRYLQAASRYGRLRGLELAFKRPDETTIELLRDITMRNERWDGRILEQGMAMEALVYLGRWQEAVVPIIRWGLPVRMRLLRECVGHGPVEDSVIAPALEALDRGETINTGAILALGLGGRSDQVARIRSILRCAGPGSELAQACVISLGLLRDFSPEAVELLIDQLNWDQARYGVLIGLLESDSEAALDALISRLHARFNISLAIDLVRKPYTRERAAAIIRTRLRDASVNQFQELLTPLIGIEDELLTPFLECDRIRDYLREQSFADEGSNWIVGAKVMAIRGLSKFDHDAAFLAALKTLQNPNSHDRESYPYLLVDIDGARATEALLEHAFVEEDPVVFQSMARALRAVDLSGHLLCWATSEKVECRLATCRMAAANAGSANTLSTILRKLVGDPDEEVAQAARDALLKQRDARAVESLLTSVLSMEDPGLRWILLDALLQLGDPGDEYQPWPAWALTVARDRPSLERDYINDRLKERREALANEAKKETEQQAKRVRRTL
jgi:hypothetical protein